MNDLGSHELPEVVPLSVQALERASVMQSRTGSFRLIRFMAFNEEVSPNAET
jgi:hypothetical protein